MRPSSDDPGLTIRHHGLHTAWLVVDSPGPGAGYKAWRLRARTLSDAHLRLSPGFSTGEPRRHDKLLYLATPPFPRRSLEVNARPSHLAAFRKHEDRRAKLLAEHLALPVLCPTCTHLVFTAGVCLPDPPSSSPRDSGLFLVPRAPSTRMQGSTDVPGSHQPPEVALRQRGVGE